MDVFSADWTAICRRIVTAQQQIFDRVVTSEERTVYEAVGEGGDSGDEVGVFCACTETTGRVVGERRLRALATLSALPGAPDVETAYGPFYGYPTSFVIARDGSICLKHLGAATKEQFEKEIKALL